MTAVQSVGFLALGAGGALGGRLGGAGGPRGSAVSSAEGRRAALSARRGSAQRVAEQPSHGVDFLAFGEDYGFYSSEHGCPKKKPEHGGATLCEF